MMGRPTSLTPEVQRIIVAAISRGHYLEIAGNLAGVPYRTLASWRERGEAGEAPYADFLHATKKAEAEAEDRLLGEIGDARAAVVGATGADLWQAKAWIMERRWPARWSGRVRLTVNEELSNVLKRIEQKLDPETFAKVVDATREDAAASGGTATH